MSGKNPFLRWIVYVQLISVNSIYRRLSISTSSCTSQVLAGIQLSKRCKSCTVPLWLCVCNEEEHGPDMLCNCIRHSLLIQWTQRYFQDICAILHISCLSTVYEWWRWCPSVYTHHYECIFVLQYGYDWLPVLTFSTRRGTNSIVLFMEFTRCKEMVIKCTCNSWGGS